MTSTEILDKLYIAFSLPIKAVVGKQLDAFGEKRIYWMYLLSSLALAFFVYFSSKRREKIGKYLFHPKVWLSHSALIDYCYIFFNSLVKVFLLSLILNWGNYWAFLFGDFLTTHIGYCTWNISNYWALPAFLVIFTVTEDFFAFFIHYLFHKLPLLWQFHKVHHSATVMNPITQYRIHPIELIFNNISYLIAFALVHGVMHWIFFSHTIVDATNKNIFAILFFIWGANLRHSHVRLSYFSWLENLFISPYQHQIHHSDNPLHFNKNMGSKLAIWDWLFGTLVKSKGIQKIKFGIEKEENKDFDRFGKTLWQPFVKCSKIVRNIF